MAMSLCISGIPFGYPSKRAGFYSTSWTHTVVAFYGSIYRHFIIHLPRTMFVRTFSKARLHAYCEKKKTTHATTDD